MGINGISTGYYPTGYTNNKTTKTTAGASFSNQINSIAGNVGKGHIVYMKTDDMFYSEGAGEIRLHDRSNFMEMLFAGKLASNRYIGCNSPYFCKFIAR
ncbi:MAG: hypothetical protein J1F42_05970 [Lachnospiraceae bacterium]|nr:hypothetical protein [Lachnospiraceae bacterium]